MKPSQKVVIMSNDRNHFEEYREQTRVKYEILEKYLRAYLHVLKRWNDNLLFIDGFAGPGAYQNNGSSQPGSPIRALSLIPSDAELAKRATTIFIEKDNSYMNACKQKFNCSIEITRTFASRSVSIMSLGKALRLCSNPLKGKVEPWPLHFCL